MERFIVEHENFANLGHRQFKYKVRTTKNLGSLYNKSFGFSLSCLCGANESKDFVVAFEPHKTRTQSAEILLEMFSRSPLSSVLNATIPLWEPASAQKTGLEHNVWYLVVQGVLV